MAKLNAGRGFRLLNEGETIVSTDEVWGFGIGPWMSTHAHGNKFNSEDFFPLRRKIAKFSGWNVTFKTRKQARDAILSYLDSSWGIVEILKGPHKAS
jgi:hypothetical protein